MPCGLHLLIKTCVLVLKLPCISATDNTVQPEQKSPEHSGLFLYRFIRTRFISGINAAGIFHLARDLQLFLLFLGNSFNFQHLLQERFGGGTDRQPRFFEPGQCFIRILMFNRIIHQGCGQRQDIIGIAIFSRLP